MTKLVQNLISAKEAEKYADLLKNGSTTPGKVLVMVPLEYQTTKSGLFIPGGDKEDVQRRGVLIQNCPYGERDFLKAQPVGIIVTYGIYAGKDFEPLDVEMPEGQKLVILSENEIVYIEHNTISDGKE